MIVIAMPAKVGEAKRLIGGEAQWCYLGKDLVKRESVSKVLGEENRFYLKKRLQKKSEELGDSYIGFVCGLSKRQKDELNWWASKFASKRFMQTDFYLHVCYKAMAQDLIKAEANHAGLVIVVEDSWLFNDMKCTLNDGNEIEFLGNPNIMLIKVFSIFRGLIHRIVLVVWIVAARLLVWYHHGGLRPKILDTAKPTVGIINPAERRSFKDGRYVDNYLSGLTSLYDENGIASFHIYLIRFPLSTVKYVGMNRERLWPIILNVRLKDVGNRICEYWKPDLDWSVPNMIGDCEVSSLIEREQWLEISSAGFNVHLILFDALNNFFKSGWCRIVFYTFENQPWEKMLCMAARENSVKTIGYQHSSIWRLYLGQFIGKGEDAFVPLPDKIITSGSCQAELYKSGGMPKERIVIGGAWRYRRQANGADESDCHRERDDSRPVILVALSLDISISKSMLENIRKAIVKNRLEDEVELWAKPHPGSTPYELRSLKDAISKFRVTRESFNVLLKKVEIVVSSESTTGLEAFLYGKKAISYIPENLLASDPLLDITDDRVYKWYEGEAIDIDFLKDSSAPVNKEDINTIRRRYFDEIDYKTWLACAET